MSDTDFTQGTVIPSAWLNQVNTFLFDVAGTGAGGSPASTSEEFRENLHFAKSITDYGALASNTAAVNTLAIQAAIDDNYGKTLIVPDGEFLVATTGSVIDPCGDALLIADRITLVLFGTIKSTNNCNAIRIAAGATDRVSVIGQGGSLQGMDRSWNSLYSTTNNNGCLLRVTTGVTKIESLRFVDPVQYAIFVDGQDGGSITNCDFTGGWATYDGTSATGPDNNNYYIRLNNTANDWSIIGCRTIDEGSGRKASQAIAAASDVANYSNRILVSSCQFLNQFEKATYMLANDSLIIGCLVNGCANGEAIRMVGVRNSVIGNSLRDCASGGITMYDSAGSIIASNILEDINQIGIQVKYRTDSTGGKSLSNTRILNNNITIASSGDRYEGIQVEADSANATVERGLEIIGNQVINADRGASDRGAITIFPANAGTSMFHMRIENNTVDSCGGYGIRFHPGIFSYQRVINNMVLDPGLVASRSAYRWENGCICASALVRENTAHRNSGSAAMSYGFEHADAADFTDSQFDNNFSTGWTTGPFSGFTATSLTKRTNRSETNPLNGSFTATAGASSVITNSNARAGMRVNIYPKNASAVALQASNEALYWDGTLTANTSFTLKTGAGGAAAGTETFDYSLEA